MGIQNINPTCNHHVRITASVMSVLLALAAMLNHGLFEIRQGYTPTHGVFIEAISEADRFWLHGNEAALTILPNFLLTGIVVVILGLALILFSIKYLAASRGQTILLGFFILLTLFGGGVGHLAVALPTWGFATRIHSPLYGFGRYVPAALRELLARGWLFFLIAACASWLMVMQLGVFGLFPCLDDADAILNVVFLFLLATTLLLSLAFAGAMARDLQQKNR